MVGKQYCRTKRATRLKSRKSETKRLHNVMCSNKRRKTFYLKSRPSSSVFPCLYDTKTSPKTKNSPQNKRPINNVTLTLIITSCTAPVIHVTDADCIKQTVNNVNLGPLGWHDHKFRTGHAHIYVYLRMMPLDRSRELVELEAQCPA